MSLSVPVIVYIHGGGQSKQALKFVPRSLHRSRVCHWQSFKLVIRTLDRPSTPCCYRLNILSTRRVWLPRSLRILQQNLGRPKCRDPRSDRSITLGSEIHRPIWRRSRSRHSQWSKCWCNLCSSSYCTSEKLESIPRGYHSKSF